MYRKSRQDWTKHMDFILLDLVCLYIAYLSAYYIRHGALFSLHNWLYRNMLFVLFFTQMFVSIFADSFKNILKRGYYLEMTATLRHVFLIMLMVTFYLFAIQEGDLYSRMTLAMTGGIHGVLGYIARCLWKFYLKKQPLNSGNQRSLLIVSTSDAISDVLENIRKDSLGNFHIVGIALTDADQIGRSIDGIRVTANADTLVDYAGREWVDEVFLHLAPEDPMLDRLIGDFIEMGVTTHLKLLTNIETKGKKHHVEKLGNYTVLTSSINMASSQQLFCKRAMDILGGIVGCLITGVLFLVVAPLIYIQSPGPVIFAQTRVGKNGRRFKLYKFRSMYPDAEARKAELMAQNAIKDGMMFKMTHDPRIIGGEHGIGGFIRRYSIDEFPQFWNVLKGDMSLVGTRPPTEDEWEKYLIHHRARLAIKPGITGRWQVSGRSQIVDFEEVVRLDREYIINWSIKMDIQILLKTVQVVFGADGAM